MIRNKIIYIIWLLLLAAAWFVRPEWYIAVLGALSIAALPVSHLASRAALKRAYLSLDVEGSSDGENRAKAKATLSYRGILPFVTCKADVLCRNRFTGDEKTEKIMLICRPGGEAEAVIETDSRYSGKMEFVISGCRIWDSTGLSGASKTFEERKSALMIPAAVEIYDDDAGSVLFDDEGVRFSEKKGGNDPGETFAVREYRVGDNIRSIHWKLSGKLDTPMVREYGLPISDSTKVLMETCFDGGENEYRQRACDVCAYTLSLCEKFIDEGIRHQLGWMDYREEVFHLHEINSADDLLEILGDLLGTEITRGQGNVKERFFEETGFSRMTEPIVIENGRI